MAELAFNAAEHTYHYGGARVPGVTEVLEPLQFLDGIPWEKIKAAGELGQHVHQACDLHDRGELDWRHLDTNLVPYVNAWAKLIEETGAVVISSEQRVYHPKLKYAGTLDSRIALPGHIAPCVLDRKTSAIVHPTVGPQTAAYREAARAMGLPVSSTRYCAHLKRDGTYRLIKLDDPADFPMFVSALNVHYWREKHGH
jgi:hypothetical protein